MPAEVDNSRYVGAWWIGFLVGAVFAILAAVPLIGFPSVLRSKEYIYIDLIYLCNVWQNN